LGKGPVIDLNPNLFPTLVPVSSDGYTLSQLGSPDATGTAYTIENGYIKYVVNGAGSGALGNSNRDSVVNNTNPTAGLQLDPYGRGNYGVDDFIDPGDPVEYYQFEINGGSISIIGNNDANNTNDTAINTWQPAANRVVVQTGSQAEGFVVIQYLTLAGEPVIRIKMSYTNTTGNSVTLRAARGTDPDQDSFSYGSSNTNNLRGLGSIPGTDISYALGPLSGKAIAIYCPGNGYTHNTSIIGGAGGGELYTYNINRVINNVDINGDPVPNNIPDSDIGIACAWDAGTVNADATVDLYCYYVLGNHIENLASKLGSNRGFTFTLTSADFTDFGHGSLQNVTNSSFTVPSSLRFDYCNYNANLGSGNSGDQTYYTNLLAAWTAAGLTLNSNSYAFNVTWGSGGTPSSTVVFASLYNDSGTTGRLIFAPVYTGNNDWQTSGTDKSTLVGAAGDYNLPVTFTLIQPTIHDNNNWC
jgi:hypothetical protein